MRFLDNILHLESIEHIVTEMIWTECKYKNKEGVERNDPKDMFEKEKGAIETEQSIPSEVLSGPIPFDWVPVIVVAAYYSCSSLLCLLLLVSFDTLTVSGIFTIWYLVIDVSLSFIFAYVLFSASSCSSSNTININFCWSILFWRIVSCVF